MIGNPGHSPDGRVGKEAGVEQRVIPGVDRAGVAGEEVADLDGRGVRALGPGQDLGADRRGEAVEGRVRAVREARRQALGQVDAGFRDQRPQRGDGAVDRPEVSEPVAQ